MINMSRWFAVGVQCCTEALLSNSSWRRGRRSSYSASASSSSSSLSSTSIHQHDHDQDAEKVRAFDIQCSTSLSLFLDIINNLFHFQPQKQLNHSSSNLHPWFLHQICSLEKALTHSVSLVVGLQMSPTFENTQWWRKAQKSCRMLQMSKICDKDWR